MLGSAVGHRYPSHLRGMQPSTTSEMTGSALKAISVAFLSISAKNFLFSYTKCFIF